jgi:hypothetical protein
MMAAPERILNPCASAPPPCMNSTRRVIAQNLRIRELAETKNAINATQPGTEFQCVSHTSTR